jgi:hypothetical protein
LKHYGFLEHEIYDRAFAPDYMGLWQLHRSEAGHNLYEMEASKGGAEQKNMEEKEYG